MIYNSYKKINLTMIRGELMDTSKFVEQHIVDCLRAAVVEANGEEDKATRLRAQAKLRLVCMTVR